MQLQHTEDSGSSLYEYSSHMTSNSPIDGGSNPSIPVTIITIEVPAIDETILVVNCNISRNPEESEDLEEDVEEIITTEVPIVPISRNDSVQGEPSTSQGNLHLHRATK